MADTDTQTYMQKTFPMIQNHNLRGKKMLPVSACPHCLIKFDDVSGDMDKASACAEARQGCPREVGKRQPGRAAPAASSQQAHLCSLTQEGCGPTHITTSFPAKSGTP